MSSANGSSIPQKSITRSELISDLLRNADAEFRPGAVWSAFTSLGAGTAPFQLLRLRSAAAADIWIPLLRDAGFLFFPLGGGSNLAGADIPLENVLFLQPPSDPPVRKDNGVFTVSAGCRLRNFLLFARNAGCCGMAGISGIPGSVGGALFMNAGANGVCISDFLECLTLLDLTTGSLSCHKKEDFPWHYRSSGLPPDRLILSADFRFPEGDEAAERDAWDRESERRVRAPAGRSAGSTFKNPGEGLPSAGKLLEDSGVKGMSEGAFRVSEQHANWVINTGKMPAYAADYRCLTERMKQAVREHFSIELQTEVRFADGGGERK